METTNRRRQDRLGQIDRRRIAQNRRSRRKTERPDPAAVRDYAQRSRQAGQGLLLQAQVLRQALLRCNKKTGSCVRNRTKLTKCSTLCRERMAWTYLGSWLALRRSARTITICSPHCRQGIFNACCLI